MSRHTRETEDEMHTRHPGKIWGHGNWANWKWDEKPRWCERCIQTDFKMKSPSMSFPASKVHRYLWPIFNVIGTAAPTEMHNRQRVSDAARASRASRAAWPRWACAIAYLTDISSRSSWAQGCRISSCSFVSLIRLEPLAPPTTVSWVTWGYVCRTPRLTTMCEVVDRTWYLSALNE